jgi:hypothetical protein
MPKIFSYACQRSGCTHTRENPKIVRGSSAVWVCPTHRVRGILLGEEDTAPTTAPQMALDFGDDAASMGIGSEYKEVKFTIPGRAEVTFHVYRPLAFPYSDGSTLLIVAHGRQDAAAPGTEGTILSHYAFMTPKECSLVREYFVHNHSLGTHAMIFEILARSGQWPQTFTPNSFVGPHAAEDRFELTMPALSEASVFCAVAVFTKMRFSPNCEPQYIADGKIPLPAVIDFFRQCGYQRFLLMCCRSKWTGSTAAMPPSGEPQPPGLWRLYSYNDVTRIDVPRRTYPLMSPQIPEMDSLSPRGSGLMSPSHHGSGLMSPSRHGSEMGSPPRPSALLISPPRHGSGYVPPSPQGSGLISPPRPSALLISPPRPGTPPPFSPSDPFRRK